MAKIIGNCKIGNKLMARVKDCEKTEVLTVVGVKAKIRNNNNFSKIVCKNKYGTHFEFFIVCVSENWKYDLLDQTRAMNMTKTVAFSTTGKAKDRFVLYAIE